MGCLTDAVVSLLEHSEDCSQCAPIIVRKVFTEEFLSWAVDPSSPFFSELGNCQNNIYNETKGEPKEESSTNFIEDYVAISLGSDIEVESVSDLFDISLESVSSESDRLKKESSNTSNPEFHITFEDITIVQDKSEELYCTIDNFNARSVSVSSLSSLDIKYDNEEYEPVIGLVSVSSLSSLDIKYDNEEYEPVIGLHFIVRTEVFATLESQICCNLCQTQIKIRQHDGLKKHVTSRLHSNNVLKKVYNEVFPETNTMDSWTNTMDSFLLYLSTVRMYQEREMKEEDQLAKIFRDYINDEFSDLVEKLNVGISCCPETEEIRFDMRKGFVKVFGVIDNLQSKSSTIIRRKTVYIILKEAPVYLKEQVGCVVWVAGNVSKRVGALVMIVKAWGVVQSTPEKILVTTKFSGHEERSVEEDRGKRKSGGFDKRKSEEKENTSQTQRCYPLTRTTDLHKFKGMHVSVYGQITGHRVVAGPLVLASFSDQFGTCQVTLRGDKCCQIEELSAYNSVLIEGKCYYVRYKIGKIELVLDQWYPRRDEETPTRHVENATNRKSTSPNSALRMGRTVKQETVDVRYKPAGSFESNDVRYEPSGVLDTNDVLYKPSGVLETSDLRYKASGVVETSDLRHKASGVLETSDLRHKASGVLKTSDLRHKPSGPPVDMPELIPLPGISKDKIMQVIERDYAPVVFVENLHHYTDRKVLTWGTLRNLRTDKRGKRASISKGGASVEVQFPRSLTVMHDSKSLAVVVEGFVRREGTSLLVDVIYTEPVGEMVSTLGYQAHSHINVKSTSSMPTCQLTELSRHLGKHVVVKTKINNICTRRGSRVAELISGEFEDQGTIWAICRFRIICCFERYKSFKPTNQIVAVVKVDKTIKGDEITPGVSVEYMILHQ